MEPIELHHLQETLQIYPEATKQNPFNMPEAMVESKSRWLSESNVGQVLITVVINTYLYKWVCWGHSPIFNDDLEHLHKNPWKTVVADVVFSREGYSDSRKDIYQKNKQTYFSFRH